MAILLGPVNEIFKRVCSARKTTLSENEVKKLHLRENSATKKNALLETVIGGLIRATDNRLGGRGKLLSNSMGPKKSGISFRIQRR